MPIINGNAANNTLWGTNGNDTITGYGGNDTLIGGFGADFMYGNNGDDTFWSDVNDGAPDKMFGGLGNDSYILWDEGDRVIENAGQGTDTVWVRGPGWTVDLNVENTVLEGSGNSYLVGNYQNNNLWGNAGNNRIDAGAGNDFIDGGAGADTILGGDGNDTMYSGNDYVVDQLQGGTGNDVYYVSGNDIIVEQPNQGNDIAYVSGSWDSNTQVMGGSLETVVLDESSAGFNGYLNGNGSNETLIGNSGNNRIDGSYGNDTIFGGGGHDTLISGWGQDYVDGGDGNDWLFSGPDHGDTLVGGAGSDVFRFDSIYTHGYPVAYQDTIKDFQLGVDKISVGGPWTFNHMEQTASGYDPGGANTDLVFTSGTSSLTVHLAGISSDHLAQTVGAAGGWDMFLA